jgi:hypothetical protein
MASATIAVGALAGIGVFGWVSALRTVAVTFAFWVFALCLVNDLRSSWRRLVGWSLVTPCAVVAFSGYWALIGGWTMVITFGLVALHPRIVRFARTDGIADSPSATAGTSRRVYAGAGAGSEPPAEPTTAFFSRPARLSDDALRQCWEASFALLQRAQTLSEATRIVTYRESCLDEIARRSPESFRLWIEAGAPNVDEPARRLPSTFTTSSSS